VNDVRSNVVRDRIVRTAAALFYVHGLRGVGVNRIIEEAEVAKATFYRHFPSKEHLVLAYLDEMDRLWKIELRRAAGQETDTSADRLTAMFDALLWEGHPGEYRGAAFQKASAEAGAGSAVHSRIAEHRAGVLEWIRLMTRQAGAADPDGLAGTLALLMEGAQALGMPTPDHDAPRLAQAAARHLIQEALAAATPR
jgi:AcrR family transcriptional regulator